MIPYRSLQRKSGFPFATVLLILMNLAVFAYEIKIGPDALDRFITEHGFTPAHFEPLDAISSLFIHGGWLHVIVNMLYLWVFGELIEGTLGFRRLLQFYFCAGLVAVASQSALDWGSMLPQIGASGAVAGVLGLSLRFHPKTPIGVIIPIFVFLKRIILPAWLVLGLWFGLQLLQGYLSLDAPHEVTIAFFAHIGGFLFGLLLGPVFRKS